MKKISINIFIQLFSFIFPIYAFAGTGIEGTNLASLFIILLITIVIFLICRELLCWYWKINQTISILIDIRDSLNHIKKTGLPNNTNVIDIGSTSKDDISYCPICKKNDVYFDAYNKPFCPNCGKYTI